MMKLAVHNTDSPISSIEDIIEDARNGRPYILVDAEDRENEGDIVIPAQFATPARVGSASPASKVVTSALAFESRWRSASSPTMLWPRTPQADAVDAAPTHSRATATMRSESGMAMPTG